MRKKPPKLCIDCEAEIKRRSTHCKSCRAKRQGLGYEIRSSPLREFVNPISFTKAESYFIAGLITGEGYFGFRFQGTSPRFRVGITLASHEYDLLQWLQRGFGGIGRLTFRKRVSTRYQDGFISCVEWQVERNDEIRKVIRPFFEQYPPRFAKGRAFVEWCNLMDLVDTNRYKLHEIAYEVLNIARNINKHIVLETIEEVKVLCNI